MVSLTDAILREDIETVKHLVVHSDLAEIDEYGFTPLIEAAIVDNIPITELLLKHGADPNQQDLTGGTALHWAVENHNLALTQLLLAHGANPNSCNFAGQSVLVIPVLRRQAQLRKLLIEKGANLTFAEDYINAKMLGHFFELVGMANIISPQQKYVEVDFEGFYLEMTLNIMAESLQQFQNHFMARQFREYAEITTNIVHTLKNALMLTKYQQYRINLSQHVTTINQLLDKNPLLIPIGYEGHAITFIYFNNIWVHIDRRQDTGFASTVNFYYIQHKDRLTIKFLKHLLYSKQSSQFINQELNQYLGLTPFEALNISVQKSGNCSWANVEAAIPALFFLLTREPKKINSTKSLALNFFERFREWNKDRALDWCVQTFERTSSLRRKATKAEILAAILFQRCQEEKVEDQSRIARILAVLQNSSYQYVLENYLRTYYYQGQTEEGKQFAALLKRHHYRSTP